MQALRDHEQLHQEGSEPYRSVAKSESPLKKAKRNKGAAKEDLGFPHSNGKVQVSHQSNHGSRIL
jgi:hypothetical protein